MSELKITTLIEDTSQNDCLVAEHGLSMYLEVDGVSILFDTGQSNQFIINAHKLGKSLEALDYVILSHAHYDHTNGLAFLANQVNTQTKFLAGKEIFETKYKIAEDGRYKEIGCAYPKEYLEGKGIAIQPVTEGEVKLTEHVTIYKNFEQVYEYEKLNEKFILDDKEHSVDLFRDEIALGIHTEKGMIVIVGCSHIGVSNILATIQKRSKDKIYTVIGGTHLIGATTERIDQTIKTFQELGVEQVAVSHCTGEEGIAALKKEYQQKFIQNNTGNILSFIL